MTLAVRSTKGKPHWDNKSCITNNFYDGPDEAKYKKLILPWGKLMKNSLMKKKHTSKDDKNDGFTVAGQGRKVSQEFFITAQTINEETDQTTTTIILQGVSKVER